MRSSKSSSLAHKMKPIFSDAPSQDKHRFEKAMDKLQDALELSYLGQMKTEQLICRAISAIKLQSRGIHCYESRANWQRVSNFQTNSDESLEEQDFDVSPVIQTHSVSVKSESIFDSQYSDEPPRKKRRLTSNPLVDNQSRDELSDDESTMTDDNMQYDVSVDEESSDEPTGSTYSVTSSQFMRL